MSYFEVTDTDVSSGWRPLSETEQHRAGELITAAASWIHRRKPSLAPDDQDARFVIVDAVRTALRNDKYAGHASYSRSTGGVSRSGTLVSPGEALVFTKVHRELLGIPLAAEPEWHFGD